MVSSLKEIEHFRTSGYTTFQSHFIFDPMLSSRWSSQNKIIVLPLFELNDKNPVNDPNCPLVVDILESIEIPESVERTDAFDELATTSFC